ncbi:hypothetical protein OC846_002368 [Tilletia horrida]|uniref:FUN14 domain-containing protein n=1 Tax=Tilletia horrida TaxID=155126 RepID=A0AAN6GRJ2_9BASI|nr:hypothetical protein OC845_002498 [Tilletia horrida]KAK0553837.1 hypothetical protein OC846_002368 [Tilletia horrida]KAK0567800.1 hypothetical protein OC861_002543 [Tilletia horrida]
MSLFLPSVVAPGLRTLTLQRAGANALLTNPLLAPRCAPSAAFGKIAANPRSLPTLAPLSTLARTGLAPSSRAVSSAQLRHFATANASSTSSSPILKALAASKQAPAAAATTGIMSNQVFALAVAGAALVLAASEYSRWNSDKTLHLEKFVDVNVPSGKADPKSLDNPLNPDGKYPQSQVNFYQLGFGTVTGFCAGIFIKKGLKALAFLLGAGYVFLQYMSSQRLVNVNWGAIGRGYDAIVDRAAGGSTNTTVRGWKGSKLQAIWSRLVDFLTADFQPRATFLAGLLLGFRLG